jgi:hypothetical protein
LPEGLLPDPLQALSLGFAASRLDRDLRQRAAKIISPHSVWSCAAVALRAGIVVVKVDALHCEVSARCGQNLDTITLIEWENCVRRHAGHTAVDRPMADARAANPRPDAIAAVEADSNL